MDPKEVAAHINIPEEIQEILERNIRTMSNKAHKSSIDNTSSTDMIDFQEDWNFAMGGLYFEAEKMLEFARSRRNSPSHNQYMSDLSPRSQYHKKPGSLTKREGENTMTGMKSNQNFEPLVLSSKTYNFSRVSLHSKPEHIHENGILSKDSESTSNNDFIADKDNVTLNIHIQSKRGRK